ncbi:MAG: hypothetical protein G01um101470_979 [Parcubacteria group bacterium Gr01-1014_70]|nr:MAG: hypothetical protein G01um101470_979 [Parcubacteria group bacterium Gr01-1014_70]
MDIRRNLNLALPGNPRYQPKELLEYFGYDNLYKTVVETELAAMEVLFDVGVLPANEWAMLTPTARQSVLSISTSEVDNIERSITQHNIRALVRIMQGRLGTPLSRWVHVPLTSYDVLDTGRILQFLRAWQCVTRPALEKTVRIFADLVAAFADTLQIGRTHGQHALPVTVGFWLATILDRILYEASKIELHAKELVGKISGAVGAHNAQITFGIAERCGDMSFEKRVLEKLGLVPARISTQILPPDSLAHFLFSYCMLSSALGQLGRDCRNLMRTEIAEITEEHEEKQEGSSEMPFKTNPIHFEGLEGEWIRTKNEFGKVMDTLISEHQRDLAGSRPARDFPIILVNVQSQLNILLRENKKGIPFLRLIRINTDACRKNFMMSKSYIMAGAITTALQMAGYDGDAYSLVGEQLVPYAKRHTIMVWEALEIFSSQNAKLHDAVKLIPRQLMHLFGSPYTYTGDARERALQIAAAAKEWIQSA